MYFFFLDAIEQSRFDDMVADAVETLCKQPIEKKLLPNVVYTKLNNVFIFDVIGSMNFSYCKYDANQPKQESSLKNRKQCLCLAVNKNNMNR